LEGWIAGLHLVTLSLRHSDDIKRFFDQPELHHYIMDYLMSQVLSSQPEVVQAWLLKTAILDRFCAPLAQAVCQPGDGADGTPPDEEINTGQEFLLWLEQSSLFTVWTAEQKAESWFRYHHLFKQFLLHHLRRRYEAAEITELHHRASVWFAENGHVEEAIRHALTTRDIQIIAQVVGRYRHQAMNQEQWTRLERWLRLLPESVINEHPEPLLLRAWLWQFGGRIWEVAPLLDRAEALLDRLPPETVESRQGEIDVLRSALAFWAADAQRGLALAEQALARLPDDNTYARDLTWLFLACHQQMLGDLPAALATQNQAMQEGPDGAFSMRRLFTVGLIYWMAGDLEAMLQNGQQLLKLARGSNRLFSDGAAHYLLGCVAFERNDLDTAVLHFTEVRERRFLVHANFYLHSLFGLALIHQSRGQVKEARELAASAVTFIFERPHLRQVGEAFLAHLALLNGWLLEAGQWATRNNVELTLAPTSQLYVPNLTLIRLMLAIQEWQRAAELLQRLRAFYESIHHRRFLIETSILQALVYHVQGDGGCALSCLEEAVQLAAPGGFIRPFVELATELDPLLAELAGRGVLPDYIAQIRGAIRGDEWIEAKLNEEVDGELDSANGQFPRRQPRPPGPLIEDLTFRELDVLRLLDLRLTNKEIANELNISVATVKRHTAHIYQKLDVNNRRQASVIARNLNLLKPD
jgi:LuxR family maltose regulon positive regulatory protein